MSASNHTWNFATIGGVKRVTLESGRDLQHLHELDQKLWTALSCPVDNLEIDRKTLELIDTDKDGQIRVPEILAAVQWMLSVVESPDILLDGSTEFPLSAINTTTDSGKALLDSAKVILKNLGKENAVSLTVEDTSDLVKIFAGTRFNGDGVITEDTLAEAPDALALFQNIMVCYSPVADRNGKPGITPEMLQAFIDDCAKFAAWNAKSEASPGTTLPLGPGTANGHAIYREVKTKIDDFFLRCRLAAFDAQATETLNLQTERVKQITDKDLPNCQDEIAQYPLAAIAPGKALPLTAGINPSWEQQVADFRKLVATPLIGSRDSMAEAEWKTIVGKFAAYETWLAEKEGASVEKLGLATVRELLSGAGKAQIEAAIAQDKDLEDEANNIIMVDRLVRYYRDLFTLLKNFVTFSDFYSPGSKAVFQAGTLYIDQRSCDLCVKVRNMGKQAELAHYSGMYLIYCDCVSKVSSEKMTIVVGLTNGDVDDLVVGRNALFYDRQGHDWDATIVKITENPTSIRQAFFAPYRRVSRFVETQINKAASAADEKSTGSLTKGVETAHAHAADDKAKKEAAQAFDVAKFAGIFAAIGLALGAIGSMFTAMVTGFLKLTWWQMPLAIVSTLLIISGPSMILAYLKLRKRNLAPILDANGWAINARVKINIHFGRTLTQLATLPPNAKINFHDPFTKKKSPVMPMLFFVLAAAFVILYYCWKKGMLHF